MRCSFVSCSLFDIFQGYCADSRTLIDASPVWVKQPEILVKVISLSANVLSRTICGDITKSSIYIFTVICLTSFSNMILEYIHIDCYRISYRNCVRRLSVSCCPRPSRGTFPSELRTTRHLESPWKVLILIWHYGQSPTLCKAYMSIMQLGRSDWCYIGVAERSENRDTRQDCSYQFKCKSGCEGEIQASVTVDTD